MLFKTYDFIIKEKSDLFYLFLEREILKIQGKE